MPAGQVVSLSAENSGSLLNVVVPVYKVRSSSGSWSSPNGQKNFSLSTFCFQFCQYDGHADNAV